MTEQAVPAIAVAVVYGVIKGAEWAVGKFWPSRNGHCQEHSTLAESVQESRLLLTQVRDELRELKGLWDRLRVAETEIEVLKARGVHWETGRRGNGKETRY